MPPHPSPLAADSLPRWQGSRSACFLAVLFLVAVLVSARVTDIRPLALVQAEALGNLWSFARGMLPPAHSAAFLRTLVTPVRETIQMALLGTLLGACLGLSLGLLAASGVVGSGPRQEMERSGTPVWLLRRLVYTLARLLLNTLRAIPELVWALLFVRALGLGPAPGILALGVSYGGMLGKVYADILEAVPAAPLEALQGTGASRLQLVLYGWLPQALPNLVAYTFYRWECALRASALMGFVGAGGIGQHIELSMRMFEYDRAVTMILIVFGLSAVAEGLGDALRRRIL